MEIKLNDYHKKVNAEKKASVAYWMQHPKPREEEIEALAGTTACRSTLVACYQRDARSLSNW